MLRSRKLITAVAAALGVALAVGAALRASQRPAVTAPAAARPTIAESPQAPMPVPVAVAPAPPSHPAYAEEPPEVDEDLELEAPESLTPPVIHVETGDASARGRAPGPEPLVPPVVNLGAIEFGRGARPTAEPLVPPVIVVDAKELESSAPRR